MSGVVYVAMASSKVRAPDLGLQRLLRFLIMLVWSVAVPAMAANGVAAPADSAVNLLQKVQQAASELDYAGVFTYQQGATMQSSEVIHMVDGTGERERIEMLDGVPREFIRHNDTVQSLIPEKKLIILERRQGDRFPGVLLGNGKNIPAHYVVTAGKSSDRVAGRECTMLLLVPKDSHRYGYQFCTDKKTNLLLKSQTFDAQGGVIDQISFSALQIGSKIPADRLATRWDTSGWKILEAPAESVDLVSAGWRIPRPPGFEYLTQVSRPMKTGKHVSQLVLSDGLAAISVFLEPYDPAHAQALPNGPMSKGALNIYGTRIGDHWLTAIGEVPPETLRELASRTEYVPVVAPK